jgi:hypothetical protein
MAYGGIKFDNITFTNAGVDANITVSGLYASTTSGLTVTGTISGNLIQGTTGIFGAGSATAPGLAVGVGTTYKPGIYSQGTDQLAISTGGTGRVFVDAIGNITLGASTSTVITALRSGNSTFQIQHGSGVDTRVIFTSSDSTPNNSLQLQAWNGSSYNAINTTGSFCSVSTGGSERLRIDSSGRLLVGTSTARSNFYNFTNTAPRIQNEATNTNDASYATIFGGAAGSGAFVFSRHRGGIGEYTLVQSGDVLGRLSYQGGDGSDFVEAAAITAEVDGTPGANDMPGRLVFSTTADGASSVTERMRIDSSGRLLVGTSTARSNFYNTSTVAPSLQVEGTTYSTSSISLIANGNTATVNPASYVILGRTRGTSVGSTTVVSAGDVLGAVSYQGSDGTEFVEGASITCEVDGAPGANDMPGRLIFATTADNAATPTERLRITSTGRVGIGVTSPSSLLHVEGSGNAEIVLNAPSASPILSLLANASASAILGYSQALRVGSVTGANAAGFSEKLRVDDSGRLLVGTTTARSNFFGTTLSAVIQTEGTGGAAGRGSLSVINNDVSNNPPYLLLGRSGAATLGSNAAVVSGSRLGTLTFQGTDGTSFIEAATVAGEVDGTPGTNDMPGRLVFSTTADGAASPTERMRIDSSGRLLVGTSTARANFFNTTLSAIVQTEGANASDSNLSRFVSQIFGTAGTGGPIQIFAKHRSNSVGGTTVVQSGDDLGTLSFQGSDGTEFVGGASITAQVDGTPGADDMPGRLVFSTTADGASSPTERMRITSGGLVGIGTSIPIYSLESSSSDDIQISLTRNAVGRWLLGTTSANNLKFAKEGAAEAMRFDASSRVLVGITSANTSGAKLQTADGLTFPASQISSSDPNTLDDYEEGTFTPTVIGLTTAGTGTYSTQSGKYIKVGGMVYVEVALDWSAHTGTGNMAFGGLPFNSPVSGNGPGMSVGRVNNLAITAGYYLTGYQSSNSALLILRAIPTGGGAENTVAMDTAAAINFGLTYSVV